MRELEKQKLVVELIPDEGLGGFTARMPDIPICADGAAERKLLLT